MDQDFLKKRNQILGITKIIKAMKKESRQDGSEDPEGQIFKTIAMIDDESEFLEINRLFLEQVGYKVLATSDPEEFKGFFDKHEVDLAILDIEMPAMSGLDLCTELKEDAGTEIVPIVFLTARKDAASHLQGFYVGAHEYLTKPYQKNDLLRVVGELLAH